MDQVEAKAKQHQSWTKVAPGWGKWDAVMAAYTQGVTDRLLEFADVKEGTRLLDVACGAGEPGLSAAKRVGASGKVIGTDFVEEMLGFARQKAKDKGLTNIEFRRADGEALEVEPESMDAVTCRWGLMFMPDPMSCVKRAFAALRPGGRMAASTWTNPQENPFVSVPLMVLKRHLTVPDPPPGAPGMFALGNPDRLRNVFEDAGFHNVTIEQVKVTMADFDTGEEYDAFIRELAGPVASLYAQLPPETQAVVSKELAEEARQKSSQPGRVVLQGVTHIVSGQR